MPLVIDVLEEEKPRGWETMRPEHQEQWLRNSKDRYRRRVQIEKDLRARAAREPRLPLFLPPPDPHLAGERRIIRAFYGPAKGLTSTIIAIFPWSPERLLPRAIGGTTTDTAYFQDPAASLGPRGFLHKVIEAVAFCGGDADVVLVHSNTVLHFDPESFREWASRAHDDVVPALMGHQLLVEDKHGSEGRQGPGRSDGADRQGTESEPDAAAPAVGEDDGVQALPPQGEPVW